MTPHYLEDYRGTIVKPNSRVIYIGPEDDSLDFGSRLIVDKLVDPVAEETGDGMFTTHEYDSRHFHISEIIADDTNYQHICRVCGGKAHNSKGIVNYHNLNKNYLKGEVEFETKVQDCLKCGSCGHSWIPENMPKVDQNFQPYTIEIANELDLFRLSVLLDSKGYRYSMFESALDAGKLNIIRRDLEKGKPIYFMLYLVSKLIRYTYFRNGIEKNSVFIPIDEMTELLK